MQIDELIAILHEAMNEGVTYNGGNTSTSKTMAYAGMVADELFNNFPRELITSQFVLMVMDNGKKEYYGDSIPHPKNVINWFRKEITRIKDIEHDKRKAGDLTQSDILSTDKAKVIRQCVKFAEMGLDKEVDFTRGLHLGEGESISFVNSQLDQMIQCVKKHGDVEPYLLEIRDSGILK